MGLDIIAVSKAIRVPCRWKNATEEEVLACDEFHTTVGAVYRRKDGMPRGCYVLDKAGREFGFRAGSSSSFGLWRNNLSWFALGVTAEEVWEHPRRYRGKPFVELIDFPDSVGHAIASATAAKLHADFAAFARRAKSHYFSPNRQEEMPLARVGTQPAKIPHRNAASQSNSETLAREVGGCLISSSDKDWMWENYRDFRRAFKIASDDGFVLFS